MNARHVACSLALVLFAAPAAALACTDGGPPNRSCNDGGAQWVGCTDHAQCPEGQYCTEQGACGCGPRDAGVCDDGGCHACVPRSLVDGGDGCSSRIRYWCPAPTVTDAAVDTGGGGGGGCAVRSPGGRAANSPLAVLAVLVGVAALARVRRR
jgi:hypothetical protein